MFGPAMLQILEPDRHAVAMIAATVDTSISRVRADPATAVCVADRVLPVCEAAAWAVDAGTRMVTELGAHTGILRQRLSGIEASVFGPTRLCTTRVDRCPCR